MVGYCVGVLLFTSFLVPLLIVYPCEAHWPVVQAVKPIEDIEAYLKADGSRPDLGTPPSEVRINE